MAGPAGEAEAARGEPEAEVRRSLLIELAVQPRAAGWRGQVQRAADGVDWLTRQIGRLAMGLLLLVVLVGTYNALARWLGSELKVKLTSNSLNELQWYLFGFVFLLGGAWTLQRDRHVRVDVLYGRLRKRTRRVIDLVGHVVFLIPFCVWAIWASIPRVQQQWSEVGPDPGSLPRGPVAVLIPVALVLLMAQAFAQVGRLVVWKTGEEGKSGGESA